MDYLGPDGVARSVAVRPGEPNNPGSPDSWFQDCVGGAPGTGTPIGAHWLNRITAALRGLTRKSGLTDAYDDYLVTRAVRSQKLNFFTAAGSGNALTIAPDPAFPSFASLIGVPLRILIVTTNAGAVTLNVNGIGADDVKYPDGSPLEGGALKAGAIATFVYDGSVFQFLGDRIVAPPALLASVSGLQSLSDNVDTTISFANTDFNTLTARGSTWNGVTFTVGTGEDGLYQLNGQFVSASSDWLLGRAWFIVNGGAQAAQTMGGNVTPGSNWQMQLTPSLVLRLAAGNTVSLGANQNNVSNTAQLVNVATRLQIIRLGA